MRFGTSVAAAPWGARGFQGALLALVAAAPLALNPASVEPMGAAKTIAVEACIAAAVLAWLVTAFGEGVSPRPLLPFAVPAALFVAALLASLRGIVNAHEGWVEIGRWGWLMALAACAATTRFTDRFLKVLLAAALAAGCVVAATVLMEASGHLSLLGVRLVFYRKDDRLLAFFGHQNLIAQYLAVVLIWGGGLLLWTEGRLRRGLVLAANTLVAAALYAAYCRSAWVAVACGGLWSLFWLRRFGAMPGRRQVSWLAVQWLCVAAAVLAVETMERSVAFRSTQGKRDNLVKVADSGRFLLWKGTLEMVREHPWSGVGAGNYPVHFPKHSPFQHEYVRWAHNDYLQLASEIGLPGLACLLALFGVGLRLLWRGAEPGWPDAILLAALAGGTLATAVDAVFSYSLYTPLPSALFWLSVGLLVSRLSREPARTPSPRIWRLLAPVGALAVGLIAYRDLSRQVLSDVHYSRGTFASGGGDAARARRELAEAARVDPDNAMIWHTLGSLWLEDDGDKALEHLEAARRLDPWQIPNLLLLCDAYASKGDLARWKDALAVLVPLDPDRRSWRNDLGALAVRTGDLDTAEREFRRIAREARWLPAAHYNLANVLAKRGNVDEALLEYNAAVVLLPGSPGARLGKAAMMERKGWHREALEEYGKVLEVAPGQAEALKAMGILCIDRLGERSRGLEYLKRSLEADPAQAEAPRIRELVAEVKKGG